MDKEKRELFKGLSFNVHKNNQRLDKLQYVLQDLIFELQETNKLLEKLQEELEEINQ